MCARNRQHHNLRPISRRRALGEASQLIGVRGGATAGRRRQSASEQYGGQTGGESFGRSTTLLRVIWECRIAGGSAEIVAGEWRLMSMFTLMQRNEEASPPAGPGAKSSAYTGGFTG